MPAIGQKQKSGRAISSTASRFIAEADECLLPTLDSTVPIAFARSLTASSNALTQWGDMEIFKFKCGNGSEAEVVKFRTESDVTCYVDTSIPIEALEGLKEKLAAKIAADEIASGHAERNKISRRAKR